MPGYIDTTPLARNELVIKKFAAGKKGFTRAYGVFSTPSKDDPGGEPMYIGGNFDEAMKASEATFAETPRYLDVKLFEEPDLIEKLGEAPKVPQDVMDEWYKKHYKIETVGEWLRFKDFH